MPQFQKGKLAKGRDKPSKFTAALWR